MRTSPSARSPITLRSTPDTSSPKAQRFRSTGPRSNTEVIPTSTRMLASGYAKVRTAAPIWSGMPGAPGRTAKYQIVTPPPTSTIAASSANFQDSRWIRRESGNARSAARSSPLSAR